MAKILSEVKLSQFTLAKLVQSVRAELKKSVVGGEVIILLFFTDRVRSTRGGNIFTLFVCSHGGGTPSSSKRGRGYPIQLAGGGYPVQLQVGGATPSSSRRGRGYPIQLQVVGVPHPAPGGGYPSSWPGGYPIQLQVGGTPSSWPGGYPIPCLGGGTPPAGVPPPSRGYPPTGVPPWQEVPPGWGTPCWGIPPAGGTLPAGVPPPQLGYPPTPVLAAAAVGMPLAFTQEDFLVFLCHHLGKPL